LASISCKRVTIPPLYAAVLLSVPLHTCVCSFTLQEEVDRVLGDGEMPDMQQYGELK